MIAFLRALGLHFLLMCMNLRSQFFSLASPLDSDSHGLPTDKCEHVFVTLIRATTRNVASGLRRMLVGFHVIVEVDRRTIQISNKPLSTEKDAQVEWGADILLPSLNRSSSISFSVYALFELGLRLGTAELLRQFNSTVGEVLHHSRTCQWNGQPQLFDFITPKTDILPWRSYLCIITERRICDTNESCPKLDLPESCDINTLEQLTGKGHCTLLRYSQQQDQMDLDAAIQTFERVHEICPIDHPNRSAVLFDFANSMFINCQADNRYLKLDMPIGLYQDALHWQLQNKNDPCHCTTVLELGLGLLVCFQRPRGFLFDREEARDFPAGVPAEVSATDSNAYWAATFGSQMTGASISVEAGDAGSSLGKQADDDDMIQDSEMRGLPQKLSHWNPHQPVQLIILGVLSRSSDRFDRNEVHVDIHEAILMLKYAVDLGPHNHPDMSSLLRLDNLGNLLWRRIGNPANINRSFSILKEGVYPSRGGHPDKPAWLNNLGNTLLRRFQHLGDLVDLNRSISTFEEAVCLTPDDHPDKPARLDNLGNSLLSRFEGLGDLADLNRSISLRVEAVYLTSGDHPDKPRRLSNLGNSLFRCFERLGDLAFLNQSITMFEEAACLSPNGHPFKPCRLDSLGNSLLSRFERLGDLADLNRSISTREEAVCLTPNGHPDKPARLSNLGNSLFRRFERLGNLADLTWTISMKEEAVYLTPDGHLDKPARLNDFGKSLFCRFERLGDLGDLNRSISMQEESVCLMSDGHLDKPAQLDNLGNSLSYRFKRLGDLADLNGSISMKEKAVCMTHDSHPDKPGQLGNLGNSLLSRFEHLGDLADLNRSILMFEEAIFLTPDGHPDKSGRLDNLGNSLLSRFERIGDLADLDRSISVKEEAIYLMPDGRPDKPGQLSNLGNSLLNRFERIGGLADLNRSILMKEKAVYLTPDGHPDKPALLIALGDSFNIRFKQSHDSSDLFAAALNFSSASRASIGRTSTRFHAARAWISCAKLQPNTTALLDAYAYALNLLPQLAWVGLPVTQRHRVLAEAADVTRDSVAAALEAGRPDLAVEWLEQGRSIVWTQFLQLRTPVDDLAQVHPALARQFQQISQQLECASTWDDAKFSQPASILVGDTRLLEKDIQRHHDLALKRDNLLVQIRSLPDFNQFLLPKMIKQLASLAISGPVVYLTASEERCDALIVMAELGNVTHVPLPKIRYKDMEASRRVLRMMLERHCLVLSRTGNTLRGPTPSGSEDIDLSRQFLDLLLDGYFTNHSDRAVKTKPQRSEGHTPNEWYQIILKLLWNDVVIPVLQALGFSNPPFGIDKMTRIFWCPTGPFSFLPIHAAGLYDTAESGMKLSDFVISSYLPTLSSLASSPQNSLDDPSSSSLRLLVVPQPPTDGHNKLFSVEDEINSIRELSDKSPFVALQNSDSTVDDVMEKLKNTGWVHFACHGIQDPKKPLDSGLGLAHKRRLKLSDIMQLSRPQGGLAFLSACQTAQGDETLSEESVHLAAGMLLAGYGGVIGTMWAIRDDDAPKVARDVYEYLFRDGGQVPDSTEAAVALHRAVQRLRDSGAPFTSWVPFIHFGR